VQEHQPFLNTVMQPLLLEFAIQHQQPTATATSEFLLPLLQALRRKLTALIGVCFTQFNQDVDGDDANTKTLSALAANKRQSMASLIGHLAREMIQFDRSISEVYAFNFQHYASKFGLLPSCTDGPCLSLIADKAALKTWIAAEAQRKFLLD
jgi:hypothetical protein